MESPVYYISIILYNTFYFTSKAFVNFEILNFFVFILPSSALLLEMLIEQKVECHDVMKCLSPKPLYIFLNTKVRTL